MFKYKIKKAMTFGEIIVVLMILGVLASVTIPGLKKYSQKTELGELGRKSFLNIEDAVDNAILTEGPVRNWDFSSSANFFNKYIEPNIRHTKVDTASNSLITSDGSSIKVIACSESDNEATLSYCQLEVDVNGNKAPNLDGKDKFRFQISKNGNHAYYVSESVKPLQNSVGEQLAKNNWKFSDNLWNCDPASAYTGGCVY